MSTLLLRLAAPLQSWGINAKFDRRGTLPMPTKSGVIGMVAAAMGRRRNEPIDDLNRLIFGVRIDRYGQLLRDYHTASSKKSSYVTHRYYLSDAVFLVGLEGDESLLERIHNAIKTPVFPLFLGRRSCPPEGQVTLGMRLGKALNEALREEEWLVSQWLRPTEEPQVRLPIVVEGNGKTEGAAFQKDQPLSFDQRHRQFGYRTVMEMPPLWVNNEHSWRKKSEHDAHDPMLALEEG